MWEESLKGVEREGEGGEEESWRPVSAESKHNSPGFLKAMLAPQPKPKSASFLDPARIWKARDPRRSRGRRKGRELGETAREWCSGTKGTNHKCN